MLIWRLVLIAWSASATPAAKADGLIVRLRAENEGYELSVLTSDRILSGEQTEFEVLVQQSDSGELARDAVVSVAFHPKSVYRSKPTPEFCAPTENGDGKPPPAAVDDFSVKALPNQGGAGIYYSAPVTFPAAGDWRMEVRLDRDRERASASGTILVSEASGRWRTLWPFLAAPFAMIAVFGANQWLRMGRLS
jgi:hypothetical protein